MSIRDDIFPTNQHPDFVQTQWAKGWGYTVIGFGDAARMLTEEREKMHASVDQIGLAVFYLQRHRVELVMKQALVDLGEDPLAVANMKHNLAALWRRLGEVVRAIAPKHWQDLDGQHGEFVVAIHEADEGSFSYRYPIDMKGAEAKRKPFIDLDALQRHADDFENGVVGYTDWIAELRQEEREYEAEMAREYEAEMAREYQPDF